MILRYGPVQERHDLCPGAGCIGGERGVLSAGGDARLDRPRHSVRVEGAVRHVCEVGGLGLGRPARIHR